MQFQIQALKSDGSILSFTVDAADAGAASLHATGEGLQVLSASPGGQPSLASTSLEDRMAFVGVFWEVPPPPAG